MYAFSICARVSIAFVLILLPLTGCANYIFRPFDLDDGDSLSLDAKQRVLLVTHEGGKTRDRKIVCAEPSPDALTATSAAATGGAAYTIPGAAGAQGTNVGASIALARTEAAASIGMRTQTVQLLRDGLYRACEAYMNGAIDQFQYNIILTNVDKLTTTLMGIDAIGGTQKAPAVAVYSGGSKVSTKLPGGQESTSAPNETPTSVTHITVPQSEEGGQPATAAQAEAIANIVLAANSQTSMPALCVSLLASGELRLDNPGQYSVLKSCDYLLHGAFQNFVSHGGRPPPPYKVSVSKQ